MKPTTRELRLPRLRAEARFEPATLNAEARTVDLLVYSGATVDRFPAFSDPYRLTFALDAKSIRMGRLQAGAPLKAGHASDNDLAAVVGVVESAHLAADGLRARVRFSRRADVESLFQDVKDRVIRNVSMEAIVHRLEDVTKKGDAEKHLLAVDWEPAAVALIGVPADPGAQALEADGLNLCTLTRATGASENPMDENTTTTTDDLDADEQSKTKAQLRAERDELKRRESIRLAAAHFSVGDVWAEKHIQLGSELTDALHDAAVEREKRTPKMRNDIGFGTDYDRGPMLVQRMSEGLSADLLGTPPTEMGRQFTGLGFTGIAHELARRSGQHTFVPKGRAGDARAVELSLTTSDYPAILGDSARRSMEARYMAATPTYRLIAQRRNFTDFREHTRVRAGDFPVLLLTGEGGEIKHGSFGESKETARLYSYGRILSFSRQALVNDDLGAFNDVMQSYGQRIADLENQLFFTLLTSGSGAGPTMSDGGALFNATAVTTVGGHANNTASGTAISDASLTVGAALMQRQVGLSNTVLAGVLTEHEGVKLNIQPAFLLCTPEKRALANQYTSANYTPAIQTNINTFGGVLTPLLDANLTGNRWYLVASPAVLPAFVYGSLESEPGPRVAYRAGFEREGLELRVSIDFGVSALEWRACYSNAGS